MHIFEGGMGVRVAYNFAILLLQTRQLGRVEILARLICTSPILFFFLYTILT